MKQLSLILQLGHSRSYSPFQSAYFLEALSFQKSFPNHLPRNFQSFLHFYALMALSFLKFKLWAPSMTIHCKENDYVVVGRLDLPLQPVPLFSFTFWKKKCAFVEIVGLWFKFAGRWFEVEACWNAFSISLVRRISGIQVCRNVLGVTITGLPKRRKGIFSYVSSPFKKCMSSLFFLAKRKQIKTLM